MSFSAHCEAAPFQSASFPRKRVSCRRRFCLLIYNERVNSTIFLVEDDADIADLMRHHLTAAGFGVRAYATSNHVLSDAERNTPALFLLDVMVPGGDGFDVCRRIREHGKLAMTPIIFVTAKTAEADRVAGLELGADDYITKPFSPKELVARVKAVLRRFERPLPSVQTKVGDLRLTAAPCTCGSGEP